MDLSVGPVEPNGEEIDTVMYLYKEGEPDHWGRYIARNDDISGENYGSSLDPLELGVGSYRVVVKGCSRSDVGPIRAFAHCGIESFPRHATVRRHDNSDLDHSVPDLLEMAAVRLFRDSLMVIIYSEHGQTNENEPDSEQLLENDSVWQSHDPSSDNVVIAYTTHENLDEAEAVRIPPCGQ